MMKWLGRLIRWWMGDYRERLPAPPKSGDAARPASERRVAVVGGGLAGLVAATTLAERGVQVDLFEANPHLGGRAGCAQVDIDGETWALDHGFHAFFYQYYNLWAFLERVNARPGLVPIEDYLIVDRHGEEYRFAEVNTTPLLNIFSLIARGLPPLSEAMSNYRMTKLMWMLRYREDRTYRRFDGLPFGEFCAAMQMPEKLQLVLTTLGRSFFTNPEKLSTAALLKSFHFYFLSHDRGLLYDYIDGDYQSVLIDPILDHCATLPVRFHTGRPVTELSRNDEDGRWHVEGEVYDDLIVSADGPAARALLAPVDATPALNTQLSFIPKSTGAGVYRLWLDRRVGDDKPVYFSVERLKVTDAISFPGRITKQAAAWCERTGGAVYELHSYALPENLSEAEAKAAMRAELEHYFPSLVGARVIHEHFDVNRQVSALRAGSQMHRPTVRTELDNLFLAGDWVRLPTPALLMEAACTAGLLAANGVLAKTDAQLAPIETVPRRGLFTWRPGRLGRPADC